MADQWVVFKAWTAPDGQAADSRHTRWVQAWCLLRDGPGFDDIFYMESDGVTPAVLPDADPLPVLDDLLFAVRRPSSS
jgi:hypothetical protein